MTLKQQIPLDLHLQSLSCQEKGSVNVLSKMTLTCKNCFYPGHQGAQSFSWVLLPDHGDAQPVLAPPGLHREYQGHAVFSM